MKYIYQGTSGMIPNIGEFAEGDEVSADIAQKLKNAGFAILEISDTKSKKPVEPQGAES